MNKTGMLAIGLGVFFSPLAMSQEAVDSIKLSDPAQSRLFLMSTGRLLSEHTFSVGTHNVVFLTGGYAPTDFLSLHASVLPVSSRGETSPLPLFSLGAKVGLVGSHGLIQGVAIGGDFFSYADEEEIYFEGERYGSTAIRRTLYTINASVSLGYSDFAVHFGFAGFAQTGVDDASADIQLGTEYLFFQGQNGRGVKLVAEAHFGALPDDVDAAGLLIIGVRFIGPHVVTELSLPLVSDDYRFETWTLPYVALLCYF